MPKRWSIALTALVGALAIAFVSCEIQPSGLITGPEFEAMLDDAADQRGSFEFDLTDLDDDARKMFLDMLPAGAEVGDGHFLVQSDPEITDADSESNEENARSSALSWFRRRRRSTVKWKKGVCYRIYNIDRHTHLSNCPYAGEAGPYDFVMTNRHQITGRCNHRNARPLGYCDELIYTCRHCGKPRHYRWTYYHMRKYKW